MDNKINQKQNKSEKLILDIKHPYCISPYLKGGIGNNLFQIAASYSYSLDNGCQYIIEDMEKLGTGHKKSIRGKTDKDKLPESICQMFPKIACVKGMKYVWTKYTKQSRKMKYINIPLQMYIRKNDKTKLIGVFASYIYFKNHAKEVKELFQYSPEVIKYVNDNFKNIINNNKTVSLHIRRGDKVNIVKSGHDIYCIPGLDYYQKAIKYFDNSYTLIIFNESIDDQWVNDNIIPILVNNKYKYFQMKEQPAIIDLALISHCRNNIISNSTFGFWGAFLNIHVNNVVIAPQVWKSISNPYETAVKLRGNMLSAKDEERLPENWIQIETECDEII